MNLADYQRAAARTSDPSRDQRDRLSNAALGLAGETGEVVELVKKHLHHGHDLDPTKLARELGDVLWYIAETCNVLGLDLASVARANVAKLQQRYPEGFSAQASRERVDVPTTPPQMPADASLVDTLTTAQEHIREALVSAQEAQGRRLYEVGVEYVGIHPYRGRRAAMRESREVPGSFEVVVGNSTGTGARDYSTYGKAEAAMTDWLGPDARKATDVCEGRQ